MLHEITPVKRESKRRCMQKTPQFSQSLSNVEFVSMPDDILTNIFKNLIFQDIHSTLLTCKEMWRLVKNKKVFRVLYKLRWPQLTLVPGGGYGAFELERDNLVALDCKRRMPFIFTYDNWYRHILARDILEMRLREFHSPKGQLMSISETSMSFTKGWGECRVIDNDSRPWILESVRLLVETYDFHNESKPKDWDLKIKLNVAIFYMGAVLLLLRDALQDKQTEIVLVALKAVGVLCRNEQNRMALGGLGGVELLVSALTVYKHDPSVLEVALWSLVHHSRPVGGVEGQSFDISKSKDYAININRMWAMDCLGLCWDICLEHRDNPSVLAKVFWLSVNLSLPEQHKDSICSTPVVELAVDALRRFPTHWELNYRAIFSLVNICCYARIKEEFLSRSGFELLAKSMANWPECLTLQRTALNVIKGFTTTVYEDQDQLALADDPLGNEMARRVCRALRDTGINDRLRNAAELLDRVSEIDYPWSNSYARMAWWMYDYILMNGN